MKRFIGRHPGSMGREKRQRTHHFVCESPVTVAIAVCTRRNRRREILCTPRQSRKTGQVACCQIAEAERRKSRFGCDGDDSDGPRWDLMHRLQRVEPFLGLAGVRVGQLVDEAVEDHGGDARARGERGGRRRSGDRQASRAHARGGEHDSRHQREDQRGVAGEIAVLGIGCYTMYSGGMDIDTVQALHGRAPSLATGVKRMQPDALVFCVQGDGDMVNEGLQEVLHTAARGENVTCILLNNGVFGETGGHMTATTVIGHPAHSKRRAARKLLHRPIDRCVQRGASLALRAQRTQPASLRTRRRWR